MPFFPGLPSRGSTDATKSSPSDGEELNQSIAEPSARSTSDNNPSVEEEKPSGTTHSPDP